MKSSCCWLHGGWPRSRSSATSTCWARGAARLFNSGKLPGCVVSDTLLAQCEKYAAGPDKGRAFFRELAAKQLAVFRGLGFAAGYLGGIAKLETFGQIIDLAEGYAADDWREFIKEIQFSQPDEFFFFEHDPQTGLGSPDRFNPQFTASLAHPPKSKEVTFNYRLSHFVHALAFTRGQGLHGVMQRLFRRWDRKPDSTMYPCRGRRAAGLLPGKGVEAPLVRMSGLRRLQPAGVRYLCPRYSCSKCGRNGPCGGSADGRCELGDKECLWARIYERLKSYGQSQRCSTARWRFIMPNWSGPRRGPTSTSSATIRRKRNDGRNSEIRNPKSETNLRSQIAKPL